MRVVVVHNRYRSAAPSGENRVADQESEALVADGHVVERFERVSDDIETWTPLRRGLVPLQVVWSDEARRSLTATLRRFRPEVVHIHNTFPLLSPSVLYACRSAQVPAVTTIHNYRLLCASGDLFRNGAVCHACVGRTVPWPAMLHRCYRGSAAATTPVVVSMTAHRHAWRTLVSAHIFLSEAQRRRYAPLGLPADRVFVKPNLVPDVAAGTLVREHFVTYPGRLDKAKGVPLLMEAWDRFSAQSTHGLRLMIAGGGPLEEEVNKWAASRPSVTALGILDSSECSKLVARSRAVILPSTWEETFGLVAIEAMAAGVPAVAAAHGSFPELIDDGTSGVLFAPGSAEALCRVLRDIDTDPARFENYGGNARRRYEERFDPEVNLQQLLDIYRFAVDRPIAGSN